MKIALGLLFCLFLWEQASAAKLVCYYTNWAQYRSGTAKFTPENVDGSLCTHYVYAFAKLNEKNNLEAIEWNDILKENGMYSKFNKIVHGAGGKTLLSLGGNNMNRTSLVSLLSNSKTMKEFAESSVQFLKQHEFDGLDIAIPYTDKPITNKKNKLRSYKQQYRRLVKIISKRFNQEEPRLLLSASVVASIPVIKKAYTINRVSQHVDWINLLAYNFHVGTDPLTGHNAPLTDANSDNSVKAVADFWMSNGGSADKLVIAVPTYGRGFTLENSNNNGVNAAAKTDSNPGEHTKARGFMAYHEVCELVQSGVEERFIEGTGVEDGVDAPYIVFDDQWVGYDNVQYVTSKARWIMDNKFAGAAIWTLDFDDFTDKCKGGKYPLIEAAKSQLF